MGFTIMHKSYTSYTYHRKFRLIFKRLKSTYFLTMVYGWLSDVQKSISLYYKNTLCEFLVSFLFLTHKNTNDLLDHSKIPIDVRKVMCFTVKGLPPIKAVK